MFSLPLSPALLSVQRNNECSRNDYANYNRIKIIMSAYLYPSTRPTMPRRSNSLTLMGSYLSCPSAAQCRCQCCKIFCTRRRRPTMKMPICPSCSSGHLVDQTIVPPCIVGSMLSPEMRTPKSAPARDLGGRELNALVVILSIERDAGSRWICVDQSCPA